jgi:hypothetical protein
LDGHGEGPAADLSREYCTREHLYFCWPNELVVNNSVSLLAPGIDVRGIGGYAIIPPSQHPSGPKYSYENRTAKIAPAPEWLLELLSQTRRDSLQQPGSPIAEGQRNSTLMSIAGSLRNRGLQYQKILECLISENQRCSPPLTISELKGIAKSAARYPVRLVQINPRGEPDIIKLADVNAAPVDWLWKPYLPLGMSAMLSGDPACGKTYLALAVAAALSVGRLPNCEELTEPSDVFYLTSENSPEHVLRPRFDSLKGDADRLHLLRSCTDETGRFIALSLSDLDLLERCLKRTNARLFVIDPIQSYFGSSVDIHRSNQTRPVLDGLAWLASRHRCCILLIRHLAKASSNRAIHRGLGSIDLTGAIRSELLAGNAPQDPKRRALVHIKTNLGPLGPSQGFSIDQNGFGWTGDSSLTAAEILSPEKGFSDISAIQHAVEFLSKILASGNRAVNEILEEGSSLGISERTLMRAKARLGVKSRKGGIGWEWAFPLSD